MPRGRPPLRIGEHGKVKRTQLAPGVWQAQCFYRDVDGVVRRPKKQTPRDAVDRHGAAAEAAPIASLAMRSQEFGADAASSGGDAEGAVTATTLVSILLQARLDQMKTDGKPVTTQTTYRLRLAYWNAVAGGLRVGECTPGHLYRALERVQTAHGHTTAKQVKGNLSAVLDAAVRDGVLTTNPARAIRLPSPPKPKTARKREPAQPIAPADLQAVMLALTESEVCRAKDLTDPMLMHLATGLRVGEVLGFRWKEFDPDAGTLAVTGRVVRGTGVGLIRQPIDSGARKGVPPLLDLPAFAVDLLLARAAEPRPGGLDLIFPSSTGTLRDPNNFARQWRDIRSALGETLEHTTGHSFRKTLGNLATDLSTDPRVAADLLGHTDTRTTLKHYLQRNRRHPDVAKRLHRLVTGEPADEPESPEGTEDKNCT